MIYTVYILYSDKHSKIYIGYSANLVNRIKSHNYFGKDWTANFRPWKMIYGEYLESKQNALKREKQLKTALARQRIWQLINNEYELNGFITGL